MRTLPAIVVQLTHLHDAWVVGSAALDGAENPRDFDLLVPFANWGQAALLIPNDARPNTFGGWKFQCEGAEIDVWPGDLAWLLTNAVAKAAWHPRSGVRVVKQV